MGIIIIIIINQGGVANPRVTYSQPQRDKEHENMGKLDVSLLRYLTSQDFRVLTGVRDNICSNTSTCPSRPSG